MKIVFPKPRMGRPALDSPASYALAVGAFVGLSLTVTGVAILAEEQPLDKAPRVLALEPAPEVDANVDISKGFLAGYNVGRGAHDIREVETPLPLVSKRKTFKRPILSNKWNSTYKATCQVLDQLESLQVTYRYTPYFIAYNREVNKLQTSLRTLVESAEKVELPRSLFQYVDDACWAHTTLRELWRMKTNPLMTQEDIEDFIAESKLSLNSKGQQFRSISRAARASAYETAATALIEDAKANTIKARAELTQLRKKSWGLDRSGTFDSGSDH